MRKIGIIVVVVLLLGSVLVTQSTYIVYEGEQAVITEFGKPVTVVTDAGLHFKTPFVRKVNRLEKRLLPWDGAPKEMQTRDKKQIVIDVWARWRISDPLKFFQSVRTERQGEIRLDPIMNAAVGEVIASNNLIEAVRSSNRELVYESEELAEDETERETIENGRNELEEEIWRVATERLTAQDSGIELTDVHLKRVNYIQSVRTTVYDRMISERLRIAELFRSQAEEEKNRILGQMQKELEQLQGETQRRSAEIRGAADALVIGITAEAYSQSPEFYGFLRRLEAYKASLSAGTRMVLSTDSELFRDLLSPPDPEGPGN